MTLSKCVMFTFQMITRCIHLSTPLPLGQTVKQNQIEYGLPLKILSYDELYGWTMDKIVEQIGKKNNCQQTF